MKMFDSFCYCSGAEIQLTKVDKFQLFLSWRQWRNFTGTLCKSPLKKKEKIQSFCIISVQKARVN